MTEPPRRQAIGGDDIRQADSSVELRVRLGDHLANPEIWRIAPGVAGHSRHHIASQSNQRRVVTQPGPVRVDRLMDEFPDHLGRNRR